MDIRIVKTKNAIRTTFLELRRIYPLEKIHVVNLCERAGINKTTFYKYYDDILSLNKALEDEIFASFVADFEAVHSLFTDPEAFIRGLPAAFDRQGDLLKVLYLDRMDAFYSRLEHDMNKYYLANHPEPLSDARVSFIVSGTVYVFKEMKHIKGYDFDTLTEEVAGIIRMLTAAEHPRAEE